MEPVKLEIIPSLNDFLSQYIKKNGQTCTHTSLKGGSYCIPDDQLDNLHLCYHNICANKNADFPALTEMKKEFSPVMIDLDLKFDKKFTKRLITKDHLTKIIDLFSDYLKDHNYILMQREKPYIKEGTKKGSDKKGEPDIVKDGIHLAFPDSILNVKKQLKMREHLMPGLETILSDLPLINDIEDIYDRSVPAGNAPWLLYFSTKPGTLPYRLTRSYKSYKENGVDLLDALSIRKNGFDRSEIVVKEKKEKEKEKKKEKETGSDLVIYNDSYEGRPGQSNNRDIPLDSEEGINICKLIDQVRHNFPQHDLNVTKIKQCGRHVFIGTGDHFCPFVDRNHKRKSASMYIDLSEQGICLRCYDSDCHDQKWPAKHIPIPKDSPVFNMFNKIVINNYGMENDVGGELLDFHEDNLQVFEDPELNDVLLKSLNGTHYDIAKLVFLLCKDKYRSVQSNGKVWYEYEGHRWHDKSVGMTHYISEQLVLYYEKVLKYYKKRKNEEDYRKKYKEINDLIRKLKTTNFKNSVISECGSLFYQYDKTFISRINNNTHLLGFENGIYDLSSLEFRNGQPSDFVSFSVGYSFPIKSEIRKQIKQVKKFLKQVFPIRDVRRYMLKLMASCLNGEITNELFHIFTGSGANGKSKFIDLNTLALGEYGFRLSISLLTQKRAASNAACPELADKMGKRLGIFQEPDKGDEIKVGIMKEITGGDIISVRQIYGQQFEYKPQFSLFLCCNDLPKIPSTDGGTWRRMRVIEFVSKFVDNPDPEKPYEFPIDYNLKDKIKGWGPAYMYILLKYYSIYLEEGLEPPEEVVKFTKMYQEETDILSKFLNECIEKTTDYRDILAINNLYEYYLVWHKNNYDTKAFTKKDLREAMTKIFGERVKRGNHGSIYGWVYAKIKSET